MGMQEEKVHAKNASKFFLVKKQKDMNIYREFKI